MDRKYAFNWDLLGDIEEGRPNLGNTTRVELYRLMQFTFRDVLEQAVGHEQTDHLFYEAGKLAGQAFYQNMITKTDELNLFISQLKELMTDLGMGILRIESIDTQTGEIILTVSEDLDCSGLPALGYEICTYDEGFICALMESFFKKPFTVKEVDCWCTVDRTCRFSAKPSEMETSNKANSASQ
ncbi:V4R domain-containing protein [Eubacteriaceae bacterium ES2]|nr:V4R domain-containing protein [Eubacteriaceae bacterium ES2]